MHHMLNHAWSILISSSCKAVWLPGHMNRPCQAGWLSVYYYKIDICRLVGTSTKGLCAPRIASRILAERLFWPHCNSPLHTIEIGDRTSKERESKTLEKNHDMQHLQHNWLWLQWLLEIHPVTFADACRQERNLSRSSVMLQALSDSLPPPAPLRQMQTCRSWRSPWSAGTVGLCKGGI